MLTLPCSRRVAAGVFAAPGSTSSLPAWWGHDDWLLEVSSAVHASRDVCTDHHVAPDTVVAVARGMAGYADRVTGRDCRPTNERLVDVVRVSLSTVQRARRVLKALGFVAELVRGRSVMTRAERLHAWRRGSAHRHVAAVFALCSRRDRSPAPVENAQVGPGSVDGDTPPPAPRAGRESLVSRTHLRRQSEKNEEEAAPRPAPTSKSRRRAAHDPAIRRLAAQLVSRYGWLAGVPAARLVPLLTRFARAGWTVRDLELAVADSMAARGWRVVPKVLTQPAAYLAALLRPIDPADRPSVLDDAHAAAERAHHHLVTRGAPCAHGAPGGDVVSPLTGHLLCPSCRRASQVPASG